MNPESNSPPYSIPGTYIGRSVVYTINISIYSLGLRAENFVNEPGEMPHNAKVLKSFIRRDAYLRPSWVLVKNASTFIGPTYSVIKYILSVIPVGLIAIVHLTKNISP